LALKRRFQRKKTKVSLSLVPKCLAANELKTDATGLMASLLPDDESFLKKRLLIFRRINELYQEKGTAPEMLMPTPRTPGNKVNDP